MKHDSPPDSRERSFFLSLLLTIRQKMAIWLFALPILLGGAFFARANLAAFAESRKPSPEDPPPIAVTTCCLKAETLNRAVRYSGIVKEWQKVELSFRVAGTIDKFQRVSRPGGGDRDLHEGDRFARGAVLAQLDRSDYELERALAAQRLAQAEAKLVSSLADAENAIRDNERNRTAYQQGAGATTDVDSARTKMKTTEAAARAAAREADGNRVQLAQANANLSYCTLTMPYECGTVATRFVEANERVTAGQKIFQILDLSSVKIAFGVSDTVVGRLAIGGEVTITSDALPDDRFRGVITKIAPTSDAQTRTYLVEVRVAEPRGLRPGMVATAAIGTDTTASLLPLVAVTRESTGGKLVAFKVVRNGNCISATACPVELDGILDNRVAVRTTTVNGLRQGDEIVVGGAPRLVDGASLTVIGNLTRQEAGR